MPRPPSSSLNPIEDSQIFSLARFLILFREKKNKTFLMTRSTLFQSGVLVKLGRAENVKLVLYKESWYGIKLGETNVVSFSEKRELFRF